MNLTIKNPKVEYTDDFYQWLIIKIRDYGYNAIDGRKLTYIDNYINNTPKYKSIFRKTINSREVLIAYLNNLGVTKYWDRVVIESNPNILIPNSTAKISNVVRLITYGTLNLKGYPIINKIFDYFSDKIEVLFDMYERGL